MYIQKNDTYATAYVEILEIIKNMDQQFKEKIPTQLISFFEENKDKNYNFKFDNVIKLEETNIIFSQKTIDLLAMLQLKYLASEKEKAELTKSLEENDIMFQAELREKYNPDNIFKNRNITQYSQREDQTEKTAIVEYKEKTFLQQLFDKIKHLFKRK